MKVEYMRNRLIKPAYQLIADFDMLSFLKRLWKNRELLDCGINCGLILLLHIVLLIAIFLWSLLISANIELITHWYFHKKKPKIVLGLHFPW